MFFLSKLFKRKRDVGSAKISGPLQEEISLEPPRILHYRSASAASEPLFGASGIWKQKDGKWIYVNERQQRTQSALDYHRRTSMAGSEREISQRRTSMNVPERTAPPRPSRRPSSRLVRASKDMIRIKHMSLDGNTYAARSAGGEPQSTKPRTFAINFSRKAVQVAPPFLAPLSFESSPERSSSLAPSLVRYERNGDSRGLETTSTYTGPDFTLQLPASNRKYSTASPAPRDKSPSSTTDSSDSSISPNSSTTPSSPVSRSVSPILTKSTPLSSHATNSSTSLNINFSTKPPPPSSFTSPTPPPRNPARNSSDRHTSYRPPSITTPKPKTPINSSPVNHNPSHSRSRTVSLGSHGHQRTWSYERQQQPTLIIPPPRLITTTAPAKASTTAPPPASTSTTTSTPKSSLKSKSRSNSIWGSRQYGHFKQVEGGSYCVKNAEADPGARFAGTTDSIVKSVSKPVTKPAAASSVSVSAERGRDADRGGRGVGLMGFDFDFGGFGGASSR